MIYNILFNDVIPIFVVMALGYAGAKCHSFTPDQTQGLNKVVLELRASCGALRVDYTSKQRHDF